MTWLVAGLSGHHIQLHMVSKFRTDKAYYVTVKTQLLGLDPVVARLEND
jgi:hypothetical protein